MIVEQIWTANAYRNFNYLIACPETGEALAVDPLDHRKCLSAAKAHGFEITQILNTHEHGDHIGGNGPMVEATGAKILAHANAGPRIPGNGQGTRGRGHRQGRPDRRARIARHPRTHDEPRLPALAHRHASVVLRRHPVQRGRRQLPQRRGIRGSSTRRSSGSSRSCPTRPGSTPATTTGRTTSPSPSTASPTMPKRPGCCAR